MLLMNLDEYIGKLSDEVLQQLDRLNQHLCGLEVSIAGIKTGELITHPDEERIDFHEREIEATFYLRAPVNALIEKWELEVERVQRTAAQVISAIILTRVLQHQIRTRVGRRGDVDEENLSYDDEYFHCVISKQEENLLVLSLIAKKEIQQLAGNFLNVYFPSAQRVNYEPTLIQWRQQGPEGIRSIAPITPRGRNEVELGTTTLSFKNEKDCQLLVEIFQEIKLEVVDTSDNQALEE
jgi:hypothetical protein